MVGKEGGSLKTHNKMERFPMFMNRQYQHYGNCFIAKKIYKPISFLSKITMTFFTETEENKLKIQTKAQVTSKKQSNPEQREQ